MKQRKKPWHEGELAWYPEFVKEFGKPPYWSVRARRLTAWDANTGCFVLRDGRYWWAVQFDTLAKARKTALERNKDIWKRVQTPQDSLWWHLLQKRIQYMIKATLQDGEILKVEELKGA